MVYHSHVDEERTDTRGENQGMAEKGSRDTKEDAHDFNPGTGLVVWKVLYIQNLTFVKLIENPSPHPSQDADWSHLEHQM